jgi:radical SAM superfamily enzyme YgiQ (UPF0313 family)
MQSKETHILPRPAKPNPQIGISWAYPSSYAVAIAGLGYQLIWWLLEQDPDLEVSRVFTDYQEPGWQTSELFGVTLSWELDYANVLNLLSQRGINLLTAQRGTGDPIVFGGGPVLSANPEPFADFFDAILTGDAEVVLPAFIEKWKQVRGLTDRRRQLKELAQVAGVYVPSLYRYDLATGDGALRSVTPIDSDIPAYIRRPVFMPPDDYVAHTVVLSKESSWADMFLVEVVRSCPQECRFCLASFLTRPFRGANVDTLMAKIDLGLKHTRKIGLLGPSVTEHPQFGQIAERLLERGSDIDVSVASIRADSIDPLILKMLVSLGQKSVTIALESGSERLRSIMKKNLTEEQFLQAMEMIAASGLSGVKLYGIAGLPGETQEDLQETVRLLTAIKKKHKHLRITFGISSFVPKAQTPFQWSGRDPQSGKKIEFLRKHLSKVGIDVRPESHNWSEIQALLSRGDRRLTPVLLQVAQSSGNLGAWKRALRDLPPGCPDADFFMHRTIAHDETLPWRHLMDDAKAAMLYKHLRTAEELALTLEPVARA